MRIPTKLEWIMAHMSQLYDLKAYVAGGAARDIYYYKTPKDWDVVIPNNHRWDERDVFNMLEGVCYFVRARYPESKVNVSQAYDGANGDFDSRWLGIAQLEIEDGGKTLSVDILFARAPSIRMVLEGFDSNVNQCYLGLISQHPMYPFGVPTDIRFLKPITTKRLNRLLSLSEELRLPVDATGLEIQD